MILARDVIIRKRDGKSHSQKEIEYLVHGCADGSIPDYQVSAWLMAAFLNGLSEGETLGLTRAMISSGDTYDLSDVPGLKVDKHSTGGVGDKISLVLAPLVAACGVPVPMTSGRGLGFTGGTLDKLESIPGFDVQLTPERFKQVLGRVGCVMSGQTDRLAPADRKLYALRDVTGTVENIPLITASILSKKFAEGAQALVMDVKSGSGAFMKSAEDSEALARSLIRTAKDMGRQVVCVLSDMGQPLGRAVGNSIEVIESVECLQGKGPGDVMELVYELGARMLTAGQAAGTVQDAREILREKISSGEAFERFVRLIDEQGGDPVFAEDTVRFPRASHNRPVKSEISGTVTSIDAQAIGTASVLLGAGRAKMEDTIDHSAGITVHGKIGDRVKPGDRLLTLHYNSDRHAREAYTMALGAYSIHDKPAPEFRLIHRVLL